MWRFSDVSGTNSVPVSLNRNNTHEYSLQDAEFPYVIYTYVYAEIICYPRSLPKWQAMASKENSESRTHTREYVLNHTMNVNEVGPTGLSLP